MAVTVYRTSTRLASAINVLKSLLTNHPLVNILFLVVLTMGVMSYVNMPREQDPEINFNWVNVTTALPGASAEDVEKLVTSPLEDAIRNVQDIRFVSSNSRECVSTILIRFRDISVRTFDKLAPSSAGQWPGCA